MLDRVVVIGLSGSGKSTLAETLAKKLDLDFIESDALLWEPNWQKALDYDEKVKKATDSPKWAMAGYDKVAMERASCVIWLDYSLWTTFWQLFFRTMRRCWKQELLWGTNKENIWTQLKLWSSDSVFNWLFQTYWRRNSRYPSRINEYPHLKLYRFKSPAETSAWLKNQNC